jgi:hypothetical protein
MFARLRGVLEEQIKEVVATEITRLDLKKYADKKCGNYRFVHQILPIHTYAYFVMLQWWKQAQTEHCYCSCWQPFNYPSG